MKGFIKCVLFITSLMIGALGIIEILEGPSTIDWLLLFEAIENLIIGLILAMPILVICIIVKIIKRIKKTIERKRFNKLPKTSETWELKKEKQQLEEQIKQLKEEIRELKNRDIDEYLYYTDLINDKEKKNKQLKEENFKLKAEVRKLSRVNNELMDKIINHLKITDTIKDIKTTPNKQTKEDWQTINKHGLSFNKMYKPNPYYNPNDKNSNELTKTIDYKVWITDMLQLMSKSNIKSFEEMNVNPNKPMKLEVEFKLVRGSDTDNPIKSFIDLLVRYYGLADDNNFVDIHVSRNSTWANSYSDGQIKFKITNI